jgi:hypothetical protein
MISSPHRSYQSTNRLLAEDHAYLEEGEGSSPYLEAGGGFAEAARGERIWGLFGGAPNNTSEKRLKGLGKEARRVGYLWRCGGRGEVEEET